MRALTDPVEIAAAVEHDSGALGFVPVWAARIWVAGARWAREDGQDGALLRQRIDALEAEADALYLLAFNRDVRNYADVIKLQARRLWDMDTSEYREAA